VKLGLYLRIYDKYIFCAIKIHLAKTVKKKKDSFGKNLGDYYPEEKVKKAINNQCIKKVKKTIFVGV
jgi:hypothetical protein